MGRLRCGVTVDLDDLCRDGGHFVRDAGGRQVLHPVLAGPESRAEWLRRSASLSMKVVWQSGRMIQQSDDELHHADFGGPAADPGIFLRSWQRSRRARRKGIGDSPWMDRASNCKRREMRSVFVSIRFRAAEDLFGGSGPEFVEQSCPSSTEGRHELFTGDWRDAKFYYRTAKAKKVLSIHGTIVGRAADELGLTGHERRMRRRRMRFRVPFCWDGMWVE